MSHTPGPWRIHKFDDGSLCIRAGGSILKATGKMMGEDNITGVLRPENIHDDREMAGNAYLIAAAPEMYEALKSLWRDFNGETSMEWCEMAMKALAKAEGPMSIYVEIKEAQS